MSHSNKPRAEKTEWKILENGTREAKDRKPITQSLVGYCKDYVLFSE